MFGKGAIITVLGFMAAFSLYQLKLGRTMSNTTDNFNQHYRSSLVHKTAQSGMNYAINETWQTQVYNTSYTVQAEQCTAVVNVSTIGADTLQIVSRAWGYAFDASEYSASGNRMRVQDSVVAFFAYYTPLSRWFWFTGREGNVYWTTGDSVWGPVHTNGVLKTFGSPVFMDDVTAFLGIDPPPGDPSNLAVYNGNWEIGIQGTIPTDMSDLVNAAASGNGGALMNTKALYDTLTTLEFLPTGNVIRTIGAVADTMVVNLMAPTGVIHSTADVRVSGTFDGQLTIYSEGNIWIDDDLVYANNPLIDNTSDDVLGLVANNNVIVTDNAANNSDLNIQASILAVNGEFYAENYESRPVAGELNVTGSVVQETRGGLGTFDWSGTGLLSGFSKDFRFDNRLNTISPPSYPGIRNLQLLSWWE